MKVFISWSGKQSKHIAQGLRDLIPDVIQPVEAFMPQHDIEAGSRWPNRLNEELSSTDLGILCLTSENLTEPWLLYEAGALGKSMGEGRVCPILYNLVPNDVKWPLAQFQCELLEQSGIRSVIDSINSALPDHKLDDGRLERSFTRVWLEFEQNIMQSIPRLEDGISTPTRSDRDILDELLTLFRGSNLPGVRFIANVKDDSREEVINKFLTHVTNSLESDNLPPPERLPGLGTAMKILTKYRPFRSNVETDMWHTLGDRLESLNSQRGEDYLDVLNNHSSDYPY